MGPFASQDIGLSSKIISSHTNLYMIHVFQDYFVKFTNLGATHSSTAAYTHRWRLTEPWPCKFTILDPYQIHTSPIFSLAFSEKILNFPVCSLLTGVSSGRGLSAESATECDVVQQTATTAATAAKQALSKMESRFFVEKHKVPGDRYDGSERIWGMLRPKSKTWRRTTYWRRFRAAAIVSSAKTHAM